LALACAIAICGCSRPPQVPSDSRGLIGSLRTAVSAQRKDWLEQNAKLVEEKRALQKLSEEQYQEFMSIIALGREGKWTDAESETLRLEKAQQP
jgi:hypothetical protein